MRVLVAGASGAIGMRLVPRLIERGHYVVATTTTPDKLQPLRWLGAEAVVLNGLDAAAVGETVARAEPDVIVHQMTALAGRHTLRTPDRAFAVTNRLRTRGIEYLLSSAEALGVKRNPAALSRTKTIRSIRIRRSARLRRSLRSVTSRGLSSRRRSMALHCAMAPSTGLAFVTGF